MREALAIVSTEGLPSLWERHTRVHKALWQVRKARDLEAAVRHVSALQLLWHLSVVMLSFASLNTFFC